ncbi:MAG: alpha/beta hydrolase [Spirochaetes bacterium]|nr:alpha/beta hydrolase [Spirochaetota bacterium]MBU1080564.1 alpha/beta hydrolase [Spirochaetota bacterium]
MRASFLSFSTCVAAILLSVACSSSPADNPVDIVPSADQSVAPPVAQAPEEKPAPGIEYRRDIPYANVSGVELRLDLAYSPDVQGAKPLLIYVPGNSYGYYVSYTKEKQWKGMFEPLLRKAAERGYVAAAVNHTPLDRLVLRKDPFPFMSIVDDLEKACSFLASSAEEYGIDRNRVVLLGWSSGGHVALVYAFRPRASDAGEGRSLVPKIVVTASSVGDMARLYELDAAQPEPFRSNLINLDEALLGGNPEQRPAEYAAASPARFARADGPACLIIHGDRDVAVPLEQALSLDRALEAAGARHRLVVVPDGAHKNYLGMPEVWSFIEEESGL